MPKILVLHVSAGTGHTSAAKALGAAFSQQPDVEVYVEDVFDHVGEVVRKSISSGYNEISTKAQPLYTMLHSSINLKDTESALSANQLMFTLGRTFLQKFEKFVVLIFSVVVRVIGVRTAMNSPC
jgi:hypothetical protein